MKTFRHPLIALFLIFCLPAQSLAAVLIECELHIQSMESESHVGHKTEPDCHGASNTRTATDSSDFADPVTASNTTDSNTCFHCSGACQNLKPLSLPAAARNQNQLDNAAFSRLTQSTQTGALSNPSRPPCQLILS